MPSWSKAKFEGLLLQLIEKGEGITLNDELLDEINSVEGEGHHDELKADIDLVRQVFILLVKGTAPNTLRGYAQAASGKKTPTFEYPDWETE